MNKYKPHREKSRGTNQETLRGVVPDKLTQSCR